MSGDLGSQVLPFLCAYAAYVRDMLRAVGLLHVLS